MNVYLQGKQRVSLTDNDYLAQGGEAKVYRKGNTIFKIYHDPGSMIPKAKIDELQVLTSPNVLRPEDILLDKKNNLIGFTMRMVKNTVPLCKVFTNDFRNRSGITPSMSVDLVDEVKRNIALIHESGCLMVDGNEFNYLVDSKKFVVPYFIDVDSYQTKSFPAKVINPSIRDWHSQTFTRATDWFSFAIVACQIFIGIHPFKGNHPKYKRGDLQKRMMDNISIFNKQVGLPNAVRDFSHIPKAYMEWFINLFEKGKRVFPPDMPGTMTIAPPVQKTVLAGALVDFFTEITKDDAIVFFSILMGQKVIKTQNNDLFIGKTKYSAVLQGTEVVFSTRSLTPVFIKVQNDMLNLSISSTMKVLKDISIACTEMMVIENTLYVRNEGKMIEVSFYESGNNIIPTIKSSWDIMPKSSTIFSNIIYQDILGKPYFSIPLPKEGGRSSCIVKHIPELDGYKIIDAKHQSHVCVIVGHKNNQYDKFVIVFSDDYQGYFSRCIPDVDYVGVNFTVLDNNVAIHIPDDGTMEVFLANPKNTDVKKLNDPCIQTTMRLCKDGTTAMVYQDARVMKIKMRR
jgi:hypothetical protein